MQRHRALFNKVLTCNRYGQQRRRLFHAIRTLQPLNINTPQPYRRGEQIPIPLSADIYKTLKK